MKTTLNVPLYFNLCCATIKYFRCIFYHKNASDVKHLNKLNNRMNAVNTLVFYFVNRLSKRGDYAVRLHVFF